MTARDYIEAGEVIDGNHMWILQVSDDSSPHYYLRYQLCTERHEAAGMGCIPHASMNNSTILSEDIQIELECQDVDLECQDVDNWPMRQTLRDRRAHWRGSNTIASRAGSEHTNTCSPSASAHSRSHQVISYDIQSANRIRATSTTPAYDVYIRT